MLTITITPKVMEQGDPPNIEYSNTTSILQRNWAKTSQIVQFLQDRGHFCEPNSKLDREFSTRLQLANVIYEKPLGFAEKQTGSRLWLNVKIKVGISFLPTNFKSMTSY